MTSLIHGNYGTEYGSIKQTTGYSGQQGVVSSLPTAQYTLAPGADVVCTAGTTLKVQFTKRINNKGIIPTHTVTPGSMSAYDDFRGPVIIEKGVYLVSVNMAFTTSAHSAGVNLSIHRAKAGVNDVTSTQFARTFLNTKSADLCAYSIITVTDLDMDPSTVDTFYVTVNVITSSATATFVRTTKEICEANHVMTITKLASL